MTPLVDRFGRVHDYLRVSVTDKCDLRCIYCMPEEGNEWQPNENLLTFGEIERVVRLFATRGVTKVRLTGGEPLVRPHLDHLVRSLREIDGLQTIALTTNATHLDEHVGALRCAGLDEITVSLDTLQPDRFAEITKRNAFAKVWRGIESALEAGFTPLKMNVVLITGVNDDEVLDFVRLAMRGPIVVRFIEYMPFKDNGWSTARLIGYRDVLAEIKSNFDVEQVPALSAGQVAKEYLVNGIGRIGFVTSMTEDFCSSCSRMRLTSDGCVKSCLHDGAEFPLRDLLRAGATDAELESVIEQSLFGKQAKHAGIGELYQIENRTMIQIGG